MAQLQQRCLLRAAAAVQEGVCQRRHQTHEVHSSSANFQYNQTYLDNQPEGDRPSANGGAESRRAAALSERQPKATVQVSRRAAAAAAVKLP